MDNDIVSTSGEMPEKFIRELHRLTTYVKIMYKSLYPSIIAENNIAPNCQHGKIFIPEQVDIKENRFNNPTFDRAVWFMEDLISHDRLNFCERYLRLAGYLDMYYDIINYFTNVKAPMRGLYSSDTIRGGRIMCNIVPNEIKREMVMIVDPTVGREMCYIQERMPKYENNNKRISLY